MRVQVFNNVDADWTDRCTVFMFSRDFCKLCMTFSMTWLTFLTASSSFFNANSRASSLSDLAGREREGVGSVVVPLVACLFDAVSGESKRLSGSESSRPRASISGKAPLALRDIDEAAE